jgi:hypothetical protein
LDVFPDGTDAAKLPNYQMMVRSEVFGAVFGTGMESRKRLCRISQAAMGSLELLDVLHRSRKGTAS